MNKHLCIYKTILIEIKSVPKLRAPNDKQCWDTTRWCSSFISPCLQDLNAVTLSDKKERVRIANSFSIASGRLLRISCTLRKTNG